jgi:hypothetical protein
MPIDDTNPWSLTARKRAYTECCRCSERHEGGEWNCDPCSICNKRHAEPMCFDRSIIERCLCCGEQHLAFHSCPCALCHRFHSGKDCLPFVVSEYSNDKSQWRTSLRPAAIESTKPCRVCSVWHGADSCAKGPNVDRMEQNDDPLLDDDDIDAIAEPINVVAAQQSVGDMSLSCPHCAARFWIGERINCCYKGSLLIPEQIIPHDVQDLILSPEVRSKIRQYNRVMAMASVGHKNASLPDGTFVLSGKSYHRMGAMHPLPGNTHNFAQIYILDTMDATTRRLAIFPEKLKAETLSRLHNLMLLNNPYVRQYRQAAQDGVQELQWSSDDDILGMQMGAIVAQPGNGRTIVIRLASDINNKLTFIHDSHQLYHTLAYPLLFPTGTHGWHSQLMRVVPFDHQQKSVSLSDYFRHMLMHRDSATHVQRCERLALELYCDAWAQVEARAAMFHRQPSQQAKYRVGRKCAIDDQLQCEGGDLNAASIPLILPSSFVGSSKWYHMLYMDAMALPMRFNKPDLFVTMTCNPRWPEIKSALPANSHWRHHPDLVARVFWLKFKSLMKDILQGKLFGTVKSYVWRIEWQARGLPHVHLLIILEAPITTTSQVDQFISAEVPDPLLHPELHQLVTEFQIHSPCDIDDQCGCRKGKPCKRHFPKDMSRSTVIMNNAFPKYRRRGVHSCNIHGRMVSDDWVVPHNATLTLKYRCHINVESASSIKSFKYVYEPLHNHLQHTLIC